MCSSGHAATRDTAVIVLVHPASVVVAVEGSHAVPPKQDRDDADVGYRALSVPPVAFSPCLEPLAGCGLLEREPRGPHLDVALGSCVLAGIGEPLGGVGERALVHGR